MQVLNDFFLREIESVLYHRANDEDVTRLHDVDSTANNL